MQQNLTKQSADLEITVNGERTRTTVQSLDELLVTLDLTDAMVATALNETFVPRGRRAATRLSSGDRIEILAPRQGG